VRWRGRSAITETHMLVRDKEKPSYRAGTPFENVITRLLAVRAEDEGCSRIYPEEYYPVNEWNLIARNS